MEEFIQSIAKQLGISEDVAKSITSKILGLVKGKLGDSDFSSLASKIPEADKLAAESAEASEDSGGGGGLLGSLTKMASSAIGGEAGEGLEIAGVMKSAGLDTEKGASFLSKLVEFIKDKAGDQVVNQITDKIPALKSVLGSG